MPGMCGGCSPTQADGRPIKDVAADLDVSEQTLRNWVFQGQVDHSEREGVTTDERVELRELRRPVHAPPT